MTKKILMTVAAASFVSALGLSAQDGAAYRKNYSDYLSEWEADLDRRSGKTVPAPRQETRKNERYSPWTPPARETIRQEGKSSPGDTSFAVEAFYAMANDTLSSGDEAEDDISLGGFTVQYTFGKYDGWKKEDSSFPEIEYFASAGIGFGSEDFGGVYDNSYSEEISVLHGQVSVGSNLRWQLLEGWDFLVGARLGISYLSIDYEWEETYDGAFASGSQTEDALGLFYGVRVGTDISLAQNHALSFAVDYWGSTARPEFFEKVEAQSYCVFSVGYKYSF